MQRELNFPLWTHNEQAQQVIPDAVHMMFDYITLVREALKSITYSWYEHDDRIELATTEVLRSDHRLH